MLFAIVEQNNCGGRLVLQHLSQHSASRSGALLVFICLAKLDQDLWPVVDNPGEGQRVGLGRRIGRSKSEYGTEDDLGFFS